AARPALLVDEQVMHDGEEPATGRFSGLPVVELRQGTLQTILHEVVCGICVTQQSARVTPQIRDLRQNRLLLLFHSGPFRPQSRVDRTSPQCNNEGQSANIPGADCTGGPTRGTSILLIICLDQFN